MNASFAIIRAVRGPILLTTVGALFLVDQNGGISFERTWPILFILYGVLKLVERLVAPPPPPPPPPVYYPPAPPAAGPWQPPPPTIGGPAV